MMRQATDSDLGAIVEIHNEAIRDRVVAHRNELSIASRRSWLEERPSRRPVYVLEQGGEVVAWGSLSDYRSGREAFTHVAEVSYFVRRTHRRRGAATVLVNKIIEEARGLDVSVLVAILLESNVASIGFLESIGFELWGTLPRIARTDRGDVGHVYYGRHLDSVSAP